MVMAKGLWKSKNSGYEKIDDLEKSIENEDILKAETILAKLENDEIQNSLKNIEPENES